MKPIITSLLTFFLSTFLFSQDTTFIWDNFSEEDLTMTVYEADKEADAVVLGERVTAELKSVGKKSDANNAANYDLAYVYTYHVRIKILTQAGMEHANLSIPYQYSKKREYFRHFIGQTINYENGKIVKTSLEPGNIFDEEINDYVMLRKFSFPQVRVGSIIEYQYKKIHYSTSSIKDHYFQREDMPVRYSEFSVEIPRMLDYAFLSQGIARFDYEKHTNKLLKTRYHGAMFGSVNTWGMKDIPQLKEEPYISTMNDYLIHVKFQVQKFKNFLGVTAVNFSTWKSLKDQIEGSEIYEKMLHKRSYMKKTIKAHASIIESDLLPKDKMEKLFYAVRNKIEWDGDYSFYPTQTPNDALESGNGSSADINVTLLALLLAAEIEAYPALVSTRDHGQVYLDYPFGDQFNNIILQAIIDDEVYWLDAISTERPMELVGINSLNHQAWVMKGDSGVWETLETVSSRQVVMVEASLESDGTMKGKMASAYENYIGVLMRGVLAEEKEEKYMAERFKDDFPNASVENVTFKNEKIVDKRFLENFNFSIPESAEAAGDLIYFNPMLKEGHEENLFKAEKRTYPVDLPFPFTEQYILNLTIPEGYEVEDLPKEINLKLLNGAGSFLFMCKDLGDRKIQLNSKITIKQTFYIPENYPFIKEFYAKIVEHHTMPVILKKVEKK